MKRMVMMSDLMADIISTAENYADMIGISGTVS